MRERVRGVSGCWNPQEEASFAREIRANLPWGKLSFSAGAQWRKTPASQLLLSRELKSEEKNKRRQIREKRGTSIHAEEVEGLSS